MRTCQEEIEAPDLAPGGAGFGGGGAKTEARGGGRTLAATGLEGGASSDRAKAGGWQRALSPPEPALAALAGAGLRCNFLCGRFVAAPDRVAIR